jgi:tRNA pseudouridine32 synthase/23S rRNA pseudouridine746 synthase
MPPEPQRVGGGLRIYFVDDAIIVLNKPSGLLSVPGRGADKQDCVSARVQAVYNDARVVHRLDMATSGLMVMARGATMQRLLNEAFATRQVTKHYEALVHGRLPIGRDSWREIELPIGVDWPNRPRRVIDWEHGKASTTLVCGLAFDAQLHSTHVKLQPLTGRTHQLRIHLQAIGHPILGDQLYAPPHVAAMAPRLRLNASALSFMHPASGDPMGFMCEGYGLEPVKCIGEPHTEC